MCRVCDNYRKYLEYLDQPNFGEMLEGDDFIGNGGHVMSPSTDVLQAWEEEGCEPWYSGTPGGWYSACNAMEEEGTDLQEAFAPYLEWAREDAQGRAAPTLDLEPKPEPLPNRRAAVMATREKLLKVKQS